MGQRIGKLRPCPPEAWRRRIEITANPPTAMLISRCEITRRLQVLTHRPRLGVGDDEEGASSSSISPAESEDGQDDDPRFYRRAKRCRCVNTWILRVFLRSKNSGMIAGFAVISRRSSGGWTLVRPRCSNAESAVNPAVVPRPEESRYHQYAGKSVV